MTQPPVNQLALKEALKEALIETLQEQRALLQEVFVEVLEDLAMTEAIRAGRKTESISREEVFQALRSE